MRLFVRRVKRDDTFITELEKNIGEFLAELDRKVSDLAVRYIGTSAKQATPLPILAAG